MIITELTETAKEAGVKMGQAQFNREPIEGSDDMEVLTTQVGFEGSYANLTKFVNLLDKSPRFIIIENLQASAPQQQGGQRAERVAEDRCVREGEACRMTLGTGNKKQMYFLGLLMAVAAYLVYDNVLSGPAVPSQQPAAQRPASPRRCRSPIPSAPSGAPQAGRSAQPQRGSALGIHAEAGRRASRSGDHRSDAAPGSPEEGAGGRSGGWQPQPVPVLDAAGQSGGGAKGPEPKVAVVKPGPPKPVVPAGPPPEPPPVPPPYKFYGYSTSRNNGKRTAYFLDGEEILLATEGDTLRRRYKCVRISPNSVTVEDLDAKKQVSVPLTEESQS